MMVFIEKYDFLLNTYPCQITLGINKKAYTFQCAESAYQAHKCPERVEEFVNLTGEDAKILGSKVSVRPDWDKIKLQVMKYVVKKKFEQNRLLRLKLLMIPEDIVNDNTCNDTFWGYCNGEGKNYLGKILTDVKDSYNPYLLLVVGSRAFSDYNTMCTILDNYLKDKKYVKIVSGGAKGADSLAERYAKEHKYELEIIKADWDKYKKYAGYKRNEEMHQYISSFAKKENRGVVAFWNGQSTGTAHNFLLAKQYDNDILIYNYELEKFVPNPKD